MMDKNRIVAMAGFLIFGAISLVLLNLAGITPQFMDEIVQKTIDFSLLQKMPIDISYLIGALLTFPLALAFVGVYSLLREKIDWALAGASLALSILILAVFGTGTTSIILGLAVFLSPIIVQHVAIDDKKAYKEFRAGRMTSNAVGNALLAISILVAISVFIVTSGNSSYADKATDSMINATLVLALDSAGADVKMLPGGAELFQAKMDQVRGQVKAMPAFSSLKAYYPHISAVVAFSAIQLFSLVILAPLAGIYGWLLWKMTEKEGAEKK